MLSIPFTGTYDLLPSFGFAFGLNLHHGEDEKRGGQDANKLRNMFEEIPSKFATYIPHILG